MRILQIAPVPRAQGGNSTGGVTTHAWGLAVRLAECGHEVAILAHNRPFGEPWPETISGVQVFGGWSFSGPRRLRQLTDPTTIKAIRAARRRLGPGWKLRWVINSVCAAREVIEEFKPDIIHVHALESRFSVTFEANTEHIPMVGIPHSTHYVEYAEDDVKENNRAHMLRNLASVENVLFGGEWIRHHHDEIFPGALDHASVEVIPYPIDTSQYVPVPRDEARQRLGVAPEERLLLTLGNLVPRKDPTKFVRAVGLLTQSGVAVRAFMVGAGPERERVEQLIAELGLGDVIELKGHVPQESIMDYYAAADVYVFPSTMETWGLAAVEAMLSGDPVVGTFACMPEVVPDFAGIYVPSQDPADLAEAIREALERDWDRDAIRQLALSYDWSERMADYEAFYEASLSRARG